MSQSNRLPLWLTGLVAGAMVASPALAAEKIFPVSSFNRVALTGSFDVRVTTGMQMQVRAIGDQAAIDRLDIGVANGELQIRQRRSVGVSLGRTKLVVDVMVPALTAASVAGSGDMKVDQVGGASFSAAVTGSGDLDIARSSASTLNLAVMGSGDLRIAGTCQTATVTLRGSGDIDAGHLRCRDVTVALTGSGDVGIGATGTANLSLAGSGDIEVSGGAACTKVRRGSGDIICR